MIVEFWSNHCDANGVAFYFADFFGPFHARRCIMTNHRVYPEKYKPGQYSLMDADSYILHKFYNDLVSSLIA